VGWLSSRPAGRWPPGECGAATVVAVPRVGFNTAVGAAWYRLRCGLRSRWRASAGLAVVLAVLVGVVLTLAAGAVRTLTAPDRYVSSQGARPDASVEQASGPPRTAELASLPAVDEAHGMTFVFGGLVPEDGRPDEGDRLDALVFAGSHLATGARLVEGREPDPETPGEFVATRSFVESAQAAVGQKYDLWVIPQGPAAALGFDAEDQAVRLLGATLVGLVDGPSELQDGYPIAVFPETLLDAGDVGIAATPIAVTLVPGATLRDLRTQIDGLRNPDQFGIDPGDLVPSEVRDAVSAQGQGLAIQALIACVASIVVLGQLLGRQVRRAEAERLVLSAMGMTRSQVAADPLLDAAAPTFAGASAGVGLAYLASGLFPRGFVLHIEPDPGRRFETLVLVPAALVVAVLVLAWVLVAVAVMDNARSGIGRPTGVDTVARRLPVRAATALRFAFTRQAREPTRPMAAVVGAALVVAILAGALTFGASLGDMVERPARWGADFDLVLGQGGGALPDDVRTRIESDPDVAALTLFGTIITTVETDGFDVTGMLPVVGSTAPHVFEGRLAEGADEIVIGRVVARRLGVGVGDDLEVVGPAGPRTLRITGLAVLPGVEGGDGVGEGGLVTFDGVRRLDPSAAPTAAAIRLRPGAAPDAAAERLSANTGMAVGPGFNPPSVIVNVARARAIPYLVATVAGVLVLLNLAHHLILSTRRRRRDLAVLRTLGADRRWISGVVHWQASLFTIVVVALGAPIGIAAGRVVYRTFLDRIGAVDTVTLPFGFYALTLAGLVALANVVAAHAARRARRQPPAASLADE
jgi:ABC-type lipoprotein release transport system permease subunit